MVFDERFDDVRAGRRTLSRKGWQALASNPWPALRRPRVSNGGDVTFLMGPANFASQGYLWTRALERHYPESTGLAMMIGENAHGFPTDYRVALPLAESTFWTMRQRSWVRASFSHVFIEAFRGVVDRTLDCQSHLELLQKWGIGVGLVAHGSEIRIPSQHADLYRYSPFRQVPADMRDWVARLEKQARRNVAIARDHDLPVFVPTWDLLDFVPTAQINPLCIEPDVWRSEEPVLERTKPLVVFGPTKGWLKGAQYIDPVLQKMHDDGLLEYQRVGGIPASQMRSLIRASDVVVDSAGLGYYATTAVESLAAGRLAVVHVDERVKQRLPAPFPGAVIDAPEEFESLMRQILRNRDQYRELASRGPGFAVQIHGGQVSADALSSVWRDAGGG